MHSMLMATMMMVAEMIRDMEFFHQHGRKLCISEMEFQFNAELADQMLEKSVITELNNSGQVIKKAEYTNKTAFCIDDTLLINNK